MWPRLPPSTLFPYTTLFRSDGRWLALSSDDAVIAWDLSTRAEVFRRELGIKRSEEHTSELQSRLHLVCRLLLEKKIPHAGGPGSRDREQSRIQDGGGGRHFF